MARPTNAARLDRQTDEAENLIRDSLVELTRVAIKTALQPATVTCAHCRKKFDLEGTTGDAALALKLLERIAGKATEKKETGVSGELEKLLVALNAPAVSSATEAAEDAKEKARRRAQLAVALKGAAVTP